MSSTDSQIKTKDSQIIQQNKILLSGQTINLRARQLVYVLAALMDKDDPTGVVKVSAKDFLSFVNNNSTDKWSDIYQLTTDIFDHLNLNPILIKKPKGKDFIKINWLSSLGVVKGELQARFSVDIADYFLYKQGLPYTKLMWDLRSYKSNFTARLLDLFQRHHIKGSGKNEIEFEFDLEQLKLFFGVHDKYKRFFDFEKRVLQVTKTELEENDAAPYWFEYEKIKKGKAIKAIKFLVYVRPKILMELIPELKLISKSTDGQISIFNQVSDGKLSETKTNLLEKLTFKGIHEDFALKVLSSLSDTEAWAYYYMIHYGVNRTLAFTLVKDHCSFGELIGYEQNYVKHALDLTEQARLKRIAQANSGKSKKRTTPENKRGGLAKKVFVEKQHFASFMERLSRIRANDSEIKKPKQTKQPGKHEPKSLGEIVRALDGKI